VIAGPSGVGKGTVAKRVVELDPQGLVLSVSVTTRPSRPTEVSGRDYLFVSDAEFRRMIDGGELLEWAEVFANLYGTPAAFVERERGRGRDVLLEIDVQGAKLVRDRAPDAVMILLEPPTLDELARRLRGRRTDSEERIKSRLATAEWELSQRDWFDHVVVNDDVQGAAERVAAIIASSRSEPEDPFA